MCTLAAPFIGNPLTYLPPLKEDAKHLALWQDETSPLPVQSYWPFSALHLEFLSAVFSYGLYVTG